MLLLHKKHIIVFIFIILATIWSANCSAQAALLMEEPYGVFGTLNPTGHNAIYFERICAETPVKLRRCQPGELGAVIARYQGIKGYDWIAVPLVPYLYSVEDASQVPDRVDRETVLRLRHHYREAHFQFLGDHPSSGTFLHGGWAQLIGVAALLRQGGHLPVLCLFGLWIAYVLAINGPVASPKYRLPIEPPLMVLTGVGLSTLVRRRSD